MKYFRRTVSLFLFIVMCVSSVVFANSQKEGDTKDLDLGITSKSAILMAAHTGEILYNKNADERLSPASITKIMTLILSFDAVNNGQINMNDLVTTSEYAKSMGGSQVFLETGETQSVETLIKCIVVASANDASVAMAAHLCGSEAEFVKKINERASGLGMENTHFEDCCGLTDSDGHYTSAKDVALMSRELITKYPEITQYSAIWMENITHVTDKGHKEFGLDNTNKLLKQYEYTTGLKTGSTSKAKYCVSATAIKADVELIAVIMAAPDYKIRFSEAKTLLEYGFNCCHMYRDLNVDIVKSVKVKGGTKYEISALYDKEFSYICKNNETPESVEKKIILPDEISAPVNKHDVIGKAEYYIGGKLIGTVNIKAGEEIKKADYIYNLLKVLKNGLL